MSLHRFFLTEQLLSDESEGSFKLRLSEGDLSHAKVLRLEPGEHIAVVDASTDYFECEFLGYEDGYPIARIASHEGYADKTAKIILIQGIAKGDKMDEIIRHATEVGVDEFVPLACERSVVKLDAAKAEKRRARWQSIAKSAAMQSGRMSIPEVLPVLDVERCMDAIDEINVLIIFWEEASQDDAISNVMRRLKADGIVVPDDPRCRIAVAVGPEGGFSETEISVMRRMGNHVMVASLGRNILRCETAGVLAPALVAYELGELGGNAF